MAAMLKLKASFTNFNEVVRDSDVLWDPYLPMCTSWQGVTCWSDGYVRSITFSIESLSPPDSVDLTQSASNTSRAHAFVPRQLIGGLSEILFGVTSDQGVMLLLCVFCFMP